MIVKYEVSRYEAWAYVGDSKVYWKVINKGLRPECFIYKTVCE